MLQTYTTNVIGLQGVNISDSLLYKPDSVGSMIKARIHHVAEHEPQLFHSLLLRVS